jgi:tRNA-specific 2-thiouridylase
VNFVELPLPETGAMVAVGMSGGVDSTLTAMLLKERGCRVVGVTMSHWDNDIPMAANGANSPKGTISPNARHSCFGPDEALDIEQCRAFCREQGIDYHVVDVKNAYKREVLDYFRREYRTGRTPNPCVRCNGAVKFGALLEGVKALGIDYDYFCTGHYASLVRAETGGPVLIKVAADVTKDQSYFLYRVSPKVLETVRFPLSTLTKAEVRKMAAERGLEAATRSESQDFVPGEYFDALFADKESEAGDIVDIDGNVLARHRGIEYYTVGQRRGLGVSSNRPLYVHSIDAARNLVVLASNDDLLCKGLIADDWAWAGGVEPTSAFRGQVKIRLGSRAVDALVSPSESGKWRIKFDTPQRAVAPGQSAVIYVNEVIAGGGIILGGIE